ncbi:hypothetical protein [Photobacterium sp. 1_MG-2023]|uniref:hypothetical protein n=1 Tax=Photobacterium sp. 1_MG-2023 TaxID=3062646 RepID=UPI0026E1F72B|nr:hypothetical protein [Photobacterium sp. 1_MG-2023]MDO6708527.1 hypothetical protein [Photobacterium sp. 1_MG-2023]
MKYLALTLLTTICFQVSAATHTYSQDNGVISRVYINPEGAIAVQLKQGFPKAKSDNQCPDGNGWAGLRMADNAIKSAILAAKSATISVTITTEGCEGAWFKIRDIYLN